jgi:hypothetical protein
VTVDAETPRLVGPVEHGHVGRFDFAAHPFDRDECVVEVGA